MSLNNEFDLVVLSHSLSSQYPPNNSCSRHLHNPLCKSLSGVSTVAHLGSTRGGALGPSYMLHSALQRTLKSCMTSSILSRGKSGAIVEQGFAGFLTSRVGPQRGLYLFDFPGRSAWILTGPLM